MRKSPLFAGVGALLLIAAGASAATAEGAQPATTGAARATAASVEAVRARGAETGHHHASRHHHHPHAGQSLTGCADSGLLFCEDFDALPPGQAQGAGWDTVAQNGTLTVEAAGSGGNALHIHTQGNGNAFLQVSDFAPPDNSFWGRVRLRVDAFPTAPDWAHWTMVEATGQGDGFIRPLGGQYVPDARANLWGVGSDGGPTGDWTAWQRTAPAAAGVWQCVEWRMDASDNRISVWLDGEAKPELTVDTDEHGGTDADFVFPRFDTVKLGWQLYQAAPEPSSYDVRLDDIALARDRIGCDGTERAH